MGKSTPATGTMMKKREKSVFWNGSAMCLEPENKNKTKTKYNLFRHIYSVRRRNHTPISFLSPPLFQLTGKKQKTHKINSGKQVENSMTVSGHFASFFFAHCLYSFFFVLGYHLINKMAKKKVFRRRWRRFFFLVWFYFILFFLRENIQTSFVFLCWSCAARFLWKKGGVHRLFDCNWIFVGERRRQLPYKII